jgi:serine/threonine protein kinase
MATVYLAQDLRHDRKVALNVLRPELAAVLGAERFLQEIRVTANLLHSHVPVIEGVRVASGRVPAFALSRSGTALMAVGPSRGGVASRYEDPPPMGTRAIPVRRAS